MSDRDPMSMSGPVGEEPILDTAQRTALAALAQDCAPSRDLWPEIRSRIAGEPAALPESMQTALAALAAPVTPPRPLWPAIEARIAARHLHRRRAPWFAAAALAASLVVVLGLLLPQDSAPRRPPLHAPASVLADNSTPRNSALLQTATRPMRSETRALVRANLKIVNGAEAQLERAIAADPNAPYLHNLLATAQRQQQELRVVLAAAEYAPAAGER